MTASTTSALAARLAELLPPALLNADAAEPDQPLRRLLEILAEPLAALNGAVDGLEADPFVALASAEALPLIAELVGARLLGDDVITNRRVVASTVGWRRRKGSLGTLEDVLTQTSGWPVEADEGFRSLLVTQDVAQLLPSRGWTTLVWDPVALADPLTRRSRRNARHPSPALDPPAEGEDIESALRRLGASDALRLAASPRNIDLAGWAHPDGVVLRSSRVSVAERDEVVLPPPVAVPTPGGGRPLVGLTLDPGRGIQPLAGRVPTDEIPPLLGYTPVHEPPPELPVPRRPELLTPTDLAADSAAVEDGDALRITIDGAAMLGRDSSAIPGPLEYEPPGPEAVLRFADGGRPGPGESWVIDAVAVTDASSIDETLISAVPSTVATEPNPVTMSARVSALTATFESTQAGSTPIAGAQIALRITRSIGMNSTWERAADQCWDRRSVPSPPGRAVSGDVAVDVGGQTFFARLLLDDGIFRLARRTPDAAAWLTAPLGPVAVGEMPNESLVEAGPSTQLVADGDTLILVGQRDDGDLGSWRLSDLTAAEVAVAALDDASPIRPSGRVAIAACRFTDPVYGDTLTLHGGQQDDEPDRDLWQLQLTGANAGSWVRRRIRSEFPRSGGQLLASGQRLFRIGGAGEKPGLAAQVFAADMTVARPRWAPLADLPLAGPEFPGTLFATVDAAATIDALVWSDSVHPVAMQLDDGAQRWQQGGRETEAPNPPAEGEVLWVGDEVFVTGPPPLPPSEAILSVGGRGHLAFLPPIDPHPADEANVVLLDQSGSSELWYPPGEPARPSLRLGRNRDAEPLLVRLAPPAPRVGAAGRLRWQPLTVRQAVLDAWDDDIALSVEDRILLDPRLGRVVVHPDLRGVRPVGSLPRFGASYHVARGAAIGAGFVPAGATVPDRWLEPRDPEDPEDRDEPGRFTLPNPPEYVGRDDVVAAATVSVGPPGRRWGPDGEQQVGTRLDDALNELAQLPAEQDRILALVGSPRLDATTAVLTEGAVTSIVARDRGGYPYVAADLDGVSLSLLERNDPLAASDVGPHLFMTGVACGGALDLAFTTGEVDLRWCDLGLRTGEIGVRVAGSGHHTGLVRSTLGETTLTLRLHGCHVGRLEVPPWVQVIAAGCTFDGGDRVQPAIDAAGAQVRLRECTVRGSVLAGVLEASSCAFAGPIRCDRPDLGWLRRSVAPPIEDRRPRSWRGVEVDLSFVEDRATAPHYLVLDDNNGEIVLTAGEGGRPPGAHADRGRALTELTERTVDYLPLGLHAYHLDRSRLDVHRMGRRN